MGNELKVTLTVKQELLIHVSLFFLFLDGPLSAEHILLLSNHNLLLITLDLTCVLLPVKDGHSITNLLLLLSGLSHLTLKLLLSIKLPELSIDLLLHHLALDGTTLVD